MATVKIQDRKGREQGQGERKVMGFDISFGDNNSRFKVWANNIKEALEAIDHYYDAHNKKTRQFQRPTCPLCRRMDRLGIIPIEKTKKGE
jgi:hypothetical protein